MEKKNININNLERFLEKAKSKINEGVEDIGDLNMNKLEGFLSEVKNDKEKGNELNINNNDNSNKENKAKFDKIFENFKTGDFQVEYKKDLFDKMNNISEMSPFDVNFDLPNNNNNNDINTNDNNINNN